MTLHANLHLPVSIEPCRIHNSPPQLLRSRPRRFRQPHMFAARTVASGAVDTFRQRLRVNRLRKRLLMSRRNLRIRIVTKHAIVCDRTPETLMIRPVIPRIHPPITALFGVPSQRQFHQRVAFRPMQISPRMITRPHDKVDSLLHHIRLPTVRIKLVAPLIISPTPLEHREVAIRCLVIESILLRIIFDGVVGCWPVKRTRHSCSLICLPNGLMATRASLRIALRPHQARRQHESYHAAKADRHHSP
jgi:hypothetical protein